MRTLAIVLLLCLPCLGQESKSFIGLNYSEASENDDMVKILKDLDELYAELESKKGLFTPSLTSYKEKEASKPLFEKMQKFIDKWNGRKIVFYGKVDDVYEKDGSIFASIDPAGPVAQLHKYEENKKVPVARNGERLQVAISQDDADKTYVGDLVSLKAEVEFRIIEVWPTGTGFKNKKQIDGKTSFITYGIHWKDVPKGTTDTAPYIGFLHLNSLAAVLKN